MRLDLRDIIHSPGAVRDFSGELDLSMLELFGEKPFTRPVHIGGAVRNMAGALELEGTAESVLDARCDRCLKPLTLPLEAEVRVLLAEDLEDEENDDIVLLKDGQADLDELFTTACVLALDSKRLCREDCKGLCPQCGKDLNEGPCGCGSQPDPRLAVLAQLLDKGSQDQGEEA